jgi:hypothetical protein
MDHLMILGSIIADMELENQHGRIALDKSHIVVKLCQDIGREYLLDSDGIDPETWLGPCGPMELTEARRKIIDKYNIRYSYPKLVLLEERKGWLQYLIDMVIQVLHIW